MMVQPSICPSYSQEIQWFSLFFHGGELQQVLPGPESHPKGRAAPGKAVRPGQGRDRWAVSVAVFFDFVDQKNTWWIIVLNQC